MGDKGGGLEHREENAHGRAGEHLLEAPQQPRRHLPSQSKVKISLGFLGRTLWNFWGCLRCRTCLLMWPSRPRPRRGRTAELGTRPLGSRCSCASLTSAQDPGKLMVQGLQQLQASQVSIQAHPGHLQNVYLSLNIF